MWRPSYSTLCEAYAFMLNWIEENSYKTSDFARESYIDGIWNTESDADWLTELQFPVV